MVHQLTAAVEIKTDIQQHYILFLTHSHLSTQRSASRTSSKSGSREWSRGMGSHEFFCCHHYQCSHCHVHRSLMQFSRIACKKHYLSQMIDLIEKHQKYFSSAMFYCCCCCFWKHRIFTSVICTELRHVFLSEQTEMCVERNAFEERL